MVYNYISVKSIISKVYTDLDLQEKNHRESDFIEWAGEAISKIRAYNAMVIKVTGREGIPYIVISDYQAKLPKDLYGLVGVAYSETEDGVFKPLRYSSGNFHKRSPQENNDITVTYTPSESELVKQTMYVYNIDYADAVELLNTDPQIKERMQTIIVDTKSTDKFIGKPTQSTDIYYTINSNYIKLNKRDGYLMLAYTSIPTDVEGYPLVPDDEGFREAVYWYIVKKYLYPKWALGEVRDRVYYEAKNSWNFYCKQAYANATMPNSSQLEELKNKWLELIPEINDFGNFFNTSGERQKIYIH